MGNNADYDEAVANLRACLLSAKGGVSLSELNNDYKKIVGESLPYRKLGYPSLEDFLSDIPGLLITKRGNDWNIIARPTEDTVHLAQMIARQKSSSSKNRTRGLTAKRRRPVARSARAPSQFDMPSINSQQRRGPSTNYRAVQRVPSLPPLMQIPPKKTIPPLMEKPPRYMLPNPGIPQASPSKQLSDRMANKSANSITGNQPQIVAYKNKVTTQDSHNEKRTPLTSTPLIPSRPGPSTQARNSETVQTQSKAMKTISDRLNFKPQTSPSTPTVLSPLSPSQLVAAAAAAESVASLTPPGTPKTPQAPKMWPLSSQHQNPCKQVEIYAESMKLPKPSYKVVKFATKRQGSFFYCRVKIGLYSWTSYPEEIATSEEATRVVAAKALHELLQINGPLSSLTETTNKNLVKDRVVTIVAEHPNGVFMHQIPKYYQEQFKENLPEDWEKIIVETSDIFKEKGAHDSTILCLPYSSPRSKHRNSNSVAEAISPRVEKIELNPIGPPVPGVLKPPVDEYWDLCVTCVLDTTDIWARLIGEEYSERVESMLNELESYYQKVSTVPGVRDIEVGKYYAVQVEEYWHRVQCFEYNAKTGMAVIFFIDHGDDDTYHYSKLYRLEKQFCKVPAQAVKLTLANLEAFNDCAEVIEYLEEVLLGQILVAEVVSRELGDEVTASVILYDTSKEQEVNLNDLLFNRISENILTPKLNQGHVSEVYVSHVTENGDVYLHVKSDSMKYLVSLMNTLIQTGLTSEDIQRSEVKNIDRSKLYLVRCVEDGNWYRGSVVNIEAHNRVDIFLVDFGKTVVVRKKQDLLALDQLSEILPKYPYQAFKVRLHNIPEAMFSSEMATKLTLLVPPDQVILVKIVTPASGSSPPIVELVKRCEPNNMVVSINSTLAMDPNLTGSNGDGNNNTTRPKKRLERSVSRHSATGGGELLTKNLRPPVIPDFGRYFDVHITMAASPGNFTVQPYDDRVHLEAMMVQLQEVCINYTGSAPLPDSIKEGSLYAGRHFDGHFYRVCVSKIINDQMVTVYFCDFGDFSVLSTDKLQPLGRQFLDLPYQAIKARLVGIQPLNIDWSVEDCLRFQELVVERNFVSIVVDSGPDRLSPGDTVLGLKLIDVSEETDIYLDKLLIAEGRATAIEG
ncbi:tudor domain-containing protein 7B isoform X1 [Diprion similis]|uniref:tudor domain-containing protein 7B isoform X1 n=2 Tax=Diprion similis TaxID=362088 RepID=UPI001EF7DF04|nr:tudor domain-containing protein 7B isoform X1 [Diprion similis]